MTSARPGNASRRHHIRGGLGVAVIGCGTIGTLRAHILHRHPSISHLAVCDLDRGRAEKLGRDCNADAWDTDAARVVENPAVGAVIVATTEDAHYAPAMAALRAGKHLLIEKPFTIDLAEGEELLQEAARRRLQLYTGFTQRFRRRYLSVKQHLDDGYLGHVTSAHLSIS
jgi:predicted dehydrogenase